MLSGLGQAKYPFPYLVPLFLSILYVRWGGADNPVIGQVLYLEAEAAGIRATGIGCYFDDGMHGLLGLEERSYQDLYHFTVGGPVEDTRLTTLPAYVDE